MPPTIKQLKTEAQLLRAEIRDLKIETRKLRIDFDSLKSSASIPIEIDAAFRDRFKDLEIELPTKISFSDDNVASPPTDAEIDSAFGTPAGVEKGFIGIIDDNGSETTVWFVVAIGSSWWYEQLTKAT